MFDGHGGHECSQYAASHFWEAWLETRQTSDGDELQNQLKKSLELLDQRLTVRSVKEYWKGGTTAACCAIDKENKTMAFAWLGDSPGYVMNNMEFRKVTREHSPSDPEEARRVEEAGGQLFVIGGELRVNGVLNLTRALGDVPGRPMISNGPEICERPSEQGDYMVFLACDGVSDVLNTADLYNLVGEYVRTFPVEGAYSFSLNTAPNSSYSRLLGNGSLVLSQIDHRWKCRQRDSRHWIPSSTTRHLESHES